MEQSELLRCIMHYAVVMSSKAGKTNVNANYFVTALLNVVLADNRGELDGIPEIRLYDRAAAQTEIESVRNVLSRFDLNILDTAVQMEDALRAAEDDCMEAAMFRKLELQASMRAGNEGKQVLTVDLFLESLLQEPTAVITKYILSTERSPRRETAATDNRTQRPMFDITNGPSSDTPTYDDSDEKGGMFGARPRRDENSRGNGYRSGLNGMPNSAQQPQQQPQPQQQQQTQPAAQEQARQKDNMLIEHAKRVKDIQNKLLERVFGQDIAVEMFVSGYFQAELVAQIIQKRKKPRATFLFAGPPGVGKTFLAESAAEILGLPYKRFDMSEYSNDESALNFAGTDKVYKGSHEGFVTGFVDKNPRCILLFDEVEKAHLNVIHLFLQVLDAGRLRDTFTDREVDFSDAIIIFTTNAGKQLYDDPDIVNLSGVPRKTVLRAMSSEKRKDGSPFFPEAICSRFASGNVVMFNHLGAHFLLKIAAKEIQLHAQALHERAGVNIEFDNNIPYAVLYAEGGKADARAIRGKAANFFYNELYEFYRLASADKNNTAFDTLRLTVEQPKDKKIRDMFVPDERPEVLIFTDTNGKKACRAALKTVKAHFASNMEDGKAALAKNDISVIICDIKCNRRSSRQSVLNLEDIDSEGRDFFNYVSNNVNTPLYVLGGGYDISSEELLSFARNGALGVVTPGGEEDFDDQIREKCNIAKQQRNMLELAKRNQILSYQTAQSFTDDGKTAEILLFDLKLAVAVDAEDGGNVLSGVMRPDLRFDDVIGAEDAKRELGYFTEYLKNPKRFAKSGIRPPKGILLYGPPGTGKTMLAKALAGESDVTYIAVEGNSFLNKYVGEGAARVHELFATARKYAPAVLFIDEIDAIAIARDDLSSEFDRTSDVLTAFLTEMDGFKAHPDKPVFVLAATNVSLDGSGKKRLDGALLRRLDRRILVDLPNKAEREAFLRMQISKNANIRLTDEQISNIALRSTGMSLADLASIMEMALRDSLKNPDGIVNDDTVEEAFESYNSGEVKKWSDNELLRTARHEAGHALLCWLSGETPSYLTIVARADHGGYMQHGNTEDKGVYTKKELLARIRTALGGRAAELAYYGDEDGITTGPSGDLASATRIAERLICAYGMDEKIGLVSCDMSQLVSSPYYSVIISRINELLVEQLKITVQSINENKPALDKLVRALMDNNKLRGDEIDNILGSMIKRDR